MGQHQNKYAKMVGLKNVMYFGIVCLLGFNLGITTNYWVHRNDEFNKGYMNCLVDIKQTSTIEFMGSDSAKLFIKVGDRYIHVPLKIQTSR